MCSTPSRATGVVASWAPKKDLQQADAGSPSSRAESRARGMQARVGPQSQGDAFHAAAAAIQAGAKTSEGHEWFWAGAATASWMQQAQCVNLLGLPHAIQSKPDSANGTSCEAARQTMVLS